MITTATNADHDHDHGTSAGVDAGVDAATVYRFGDFVLRTRPLRLDCDGTHVPLQPQPARTLALLAERAGQVVDRRALREHLWGLDTHLDHEQAINFAIRKVRIALGDDAQAPRYVETIPRQGYRLVVAVERDSVRLYPVERRTPEPVPHRRSVGRRRAGRRLGRVHAALAGLAAMLLIQVGMADAVRDQPASSFALVAEVEAPALVRDAFERARALVANDAGDEDLGRAVALLEGVTGRAPGFAGGHLALAAARRERLDRSGWRRDPVGVEAAAHRALSLDSDLVEAYTLIAYVRFFHRLDWAAARWALGEALRRDPQASCARYIDGLYRSALGWHEEALVRLRASMVAAPEREREWLSVDLTEALFRARRFPAAIEQAEHTIKISPTFGAIRWLMVESHLRLGQPTLALAEAGRFTTLEASWSRGIRFLEGRYHDGLPVRTALAGFLVATGDHDRALGLLREACAGHSDPQLPFVATDPRFDALRTHPGYASLGDCLAPVET